MENTNPATMDAIYRIGVQLLTIFNTMFTRSIRNQSSSKEFCIRPGFYSCAMDGINGLDDGGEEFR